MPLKQLTALAPRVGAAILLLAGFAPGSAAQGTVWGADEGSALDSCRDAARRTAKFSSTGGLATAGVDSTEIYDPATNTWSSAASLPPARNVHTATLLPNGRVLVLGGSISGSITTGAAVYDPATDTWSSAANMPAPRYLHTATLLPDGKVLVLGGTHTDPDDATASAELYNPSTNTWSSAAAMPTRRSRHTATLLPNGKVLVVAGDIDGQVLGTSRDLRPCDQHVERCRQSGDPAPAARGDVASER